MRAIRDDDAAITGLGLVAPKGPITVGADGDPEGTRAAALVDEPWLREPVPEEHAAQAKFLNASSQMAVTAVREALSKAALPPGPTPDPRRGLFLAQLDWTPIEYADFRPAFADATDEFTKPWTAEALNKATLRKLNPFYLLDTLNNNAYSFVTALLGWMGPGTSLSGSSSPGLLAVSMAARAIRRGDADAMLAVGAARWSTPVARLEHARRRPATRDADVVPGEGAAAVVLEPYAAAKARGANPWAVVLGWGAGFGAPDDPAAMRTAATAALVDAGVVLGDVGCVFPPNGDARTQTSLFELPIGRPTDDPRVRDCAGFDPKDRRWRMGDLGPAGDVADVVLAVDHLRIRPTDRAVLVLTRGLDGQAAALVLARPT